MKGDQIGTLTAHPSLQELSLSNWTWFSYYLFRSHAVLRQPQGARSGETVAIPALFPTVPPTDNEIAACSPADRGPSTSPGSGTCSPQRIRPTHSQPTTSHQRLPAPAAAVGSS